MNARGRQRLSFFFALLTLAAMLLGALGAARESALVLAFVPAPLFAVLALANALRPRDG